MKRFDATPGLWLVHKSTGAWWVIVSAQEPRLLLQEERGQQMLVTQKQLHQHFRERTQYDVQNQ